MLKTKNNRAFALLMVVLILAGLLIIGVPFAVSMRLSSNRAKTALADARARFAAEGAFNHAIACLMRTQEQSDLLPVVRTQDQGTYFEPHTVDAPGELRVGFEYDVLGAYDCVEEALSLKGEIDTRNPKGTIWSADVEDEQGKINLNSAPPALLRNFMVLLLEVPEASQEEAEAIAAANRLIEHRRQRGGFRTVSEAEAVLSSYLVSQVQQKLAERLASLASFATVSSERPDPSQPHPINVNSAPQLVLAANLLHLRLRNMQAVYTPANVLKASGSLSPVTITEDSPAFDGDWTLTFTDINQAKLDFESAGTGTVNWLAQSGENSIGIGVPFDLPGGAAMVNVCDEEGHEQLSFTIFPGVEPFQKDDEFTFSTRRVDRSLARRLAAAIQAEVKIKTTTKENVAIPMRYFEFLNPKDEVTLGKNGHICAGLSTYYYDTTGKAYLTNYDKELKGSSGVVVRRFMGSLRDFDALSSVIEDHVPNAASSGSGSAILSAIRLNAFRPNASEINAPTAPFCFTTSDVYTITGRASVSDSGGTEVAVRGVRRIVSVRQPVQSTDGHAIIDTEMTLDQLVRGKPAFSVGRSLYDMSATNSILNRPSSFRNDFGGKIYWPQLSLSPRKLTDHSVYPVFNLHFGGELGAVSNMIAGKIPPLSSLPYGSAQPQSTSTLATDEAGVLFQSRYDGSGKALGFDTWPRLAYSTQHAPVPGLGSSCKSIEMWVKPVDWSKPQEYFLFDTTRPYHTVDVDKWATASRLLRQMDLMRTSDQNRVALFYLGKTKELVFRLSDATISSQSAEIRIVIDPAQLNGKWHHIKAVWAGMNYGEMALFVNGKAGGTYLPKTLWPSKDIRNSQQKWPVIVGNQIFEEGSATAARNTAGTMENPKDAPQSGDPVTVYGYDVAIEDISTGIDADDTGVDLANVGAYGGGSLVSGIAQQPTATVYLTQDGFGNVIPIAAEATSIPVRPDTAPFQERGFLRIGDEIVFYANKTSDSFENLIRGVDIGPVGYGTSLAVGATGVATEPAEITAPLAVVPISIYIDENRRYPTPRYFSSGFRSSASFLGIPQDGRNYVRIGDEFISYTHKPGTHFLVDVDGSMRGALGSTAQGHEANAPVMPVYRVGYNTYIGGPGKGDLVTLVDRDLRPFNATVYSTGRNAPNYVSFQEQLPGSCYIRKGGVSWEPRMIKFPSGRMYAGDYFSIGTNTGPKADGKAASMIDAENSYKMDRQAEAVIDELKVCAGDSSIGVPLLTETQIPASGLGDIFILYPYFWNPRFQIQGGAGEAVHAWPTQGYAQVGEEIFYYTTLHRHNVEERESGAVCTASAVSVDNKITESDNSIRWSPGDMRRTDPGSAGFNRDGGYITVTSEQRFTYEPYSITLTPEQRSYLIENGFISEDDFGKKADYDSQQNPETGDWTLTRPGGVYYPSTFEVMRYDSLEQIGDDWVFSGLDRGLFGTQARKHEPVENEEGDGYVYPQLSANVAKLQIIQRGCLGTTAKRHPVGSRVLPLYHVVSTLIAPARGEDADTAANRLYVESVANFPHRGYVQVSDGTRSEIIGYTSKGADADGYPYFEGVRYLGRRFGTPQVALADLFQDEAPTASYPAKAVVRLFEPRYDDRLPAKPGSTDFEHNPANVNVEGNPAYLEISRTIHRARWHGISWVEGASDASGDPVARDKSGTEIFILARIDGKPDWTAEPRRWDDSSVTAQSDVPVIFKFDDPAQLNKIDRDGDRIELRVYFRYSENYADQSNGRIKEWQSPVLRMLKIGYSAPSSVYQQEEVRF